MSSSLVDIGNRISSLRKERGLTQEDLSKDLYISRENIAKWETGKRDLKTGNITMLADYFKVSCDEILTGIKTDNSDANNRTGLSDKAIDILYEKFKSFPEQLEIFNYLVESGNMEKLCFRIFRYSWHEHDYQKRKELAENHKVLNKQKVDVQPMSNTESLGSTNDVMSIEYGDYRRFQIFQLSNELQIIAEKTYKYMVDEFYPKHLEME